MNTDFFLILFRKQHTEIIHITLTLYCVGGMCTLVLTDKHQETRSAKHTVLSLQREKCTTCFSAQKGRKMNVASSLVTSAPSVWPGHTSPQPLIMRNVYLEPAS